jgi:hypothetical protein
MAKKETYGLPREPDFDQYNGDLDAQHAWKQFGGLTLEQAHKKFAENPIFYQEDFMFMGGTAFAYYFPVLENHLQSAHDIAPYGDHESWIIALCIQTQFEGDNLPRVQPLAPRVLALAEFVQNNISRLGIGQIEQQHVSEAWTKMVRHVEAAMQTLSKKAGRRKR